jgi:RNA polymerase sigma-70 factor (ECF subfamily)
MRHSSRDRHTRNKHEVDSLPIVSPPVSSNPVADELAVVARLREGDEQAFETLVARHYPTMLAVARSYVQSRSIAEEVVQEAWLGFLQSLERFEGRSSLKTWIIAIVVNKAKARVVREGRTVPFSALAPDGPAVSADRFHGPGETYPGHWRSAPPPWSAPPEVISQDRETLRAVMGAIAGLPPAQQAVIRMRDLQGCSADEVCSALDVSAANQRVLLHRARSRVRAAVEAHVSA